MSTLNKAQRAIWRKRVHNMSSRQLRNVLKTRASDTAKRMVISELRRREVAREQQEA